MSAMVLTHTLMHMCFFLGRVLSFQETPQGTMAHKILKHMVSHRRPSHGTEVR